MVSLLAQTEPIYTGNYLVSLQLLWSQGIRVSHCLSFKIWFMCLMAPSSQSIRKKLPNIKIAEFPLSKLNCLVVKFSTSCSYSSLTDRSHHPAHKWEVLCNLLTIPPRVHHWLPAAHYQVCVPTTHWQELMVPTPSRFSNENNASPRTPEPCLDVFAPGGRGSSLLSAALWIWVLLWADVSWFLFSTSSYCAGWHFASALTRQLDMRSSH